MQDPLNKSHPKKEKKKKPKKKHTLFPSSALIPTYHSLPSLLSQFKSGKHASRTTEPSLTGHGLFFAVAVGEAPQSSSNRTSQHQQRKTPSSPQKLQQPRQRERQAQHLQLLEGPPTTPTTMTAVKQQLGWPGMFLNGMRNYLWWWGLGGFSQRR